MKIGELAKLTGVSVRSLRYYESQGLISPIRQANGYREYSSLAVETVETIKLYLNLGLSTEQIAGFLHCVLKNKEAFCAEVMPLYRSKLEDIERQLVELNQIKRNLEERMASILQEQDESKLGTCPLENLE
ncbi:MerR family transcriptional regulator [Paenibacillus sp. FSL R7-0048]|jgi:DNA-binding transcriptional MerR regulator|uniref:MerR family transcriptional regulator n=1 Tax=Paenibacillus odorifer TaxID=189426 RepID=A0ABX3GIN2_9BACL|nr:MULTISPECIES: MerR family transcriptional regulator [Paenibacillus]MDH6429215.1 DNA-binding transcriptional MerR regulator [Paenibacillus sp. PastH-4]MDH6445422.1 DNA-binding transcriptional MerR regulator [Paenibacillus sp. PastF-4]MDH6529310.1 DNA-binding transcriptional MerR regulator [Paenibacillus sp. PastH-3]OMC63898.1 MerR family transcriptional regulator [Paenibacillus odorifer]OMC70495.1 MerR family transcriptional regulator [Paenibacillus odorifer]